MPDQRITELHTQAPLVDAHCHPSLKLYLFEEEKFDKDNEVPDSSNLFRLRVDIPSLLAGGVRVALSTAHVPEKMLREDCFLLNLALSFNRRAQQIFENQPDAMTRVLLDLFEAAVREGAEKGHPVTMCRSFDELKTAMQGNKLAFLHAVEGGHSLKGERQILQNLEDYFNRGVCLLTPAHFYDHGISPPVPGIPHDILLSQLGCFQQAIHTNPALGLHPDGRTVVQSMLELGMIVDLTHSTKKARYDIYQLWKDMPRRLQRPLVFSHVGVFQKAPLAMNPDVDELKIIRDMGGVIGVIFMNYWLTGKTLHGAEDSMIHAVETIDRLVDYGMEDCIALGSDFDGFTDPPEELKEPSDFPNLTDELITRRRYPGRRYTPEQVKKFLGGNFMRVLEVGWAKPHVASGAGVGSGARSAEALRVSMSPLHAEPVDPQAQHGLLEDLGCWMPAASGGESTVPRGRTTAEALAAPVSNLRPLDLEALEEIRRRLDQEPELWQTRPPQILGPMPTREQIDRLLDEVAEQLSAPQAARARLATLRATRTPHFELPEECRFPGYEGPAIPIQLDRMDMQEDDWGGWGVSWAAALWYRLSHPKPELPSSTGSATQFCYPLRQVDGRTTLALFSDWGSGYYHARYIIKHIASMNPGQAIHLGDVYYAGSPTEIKRHFQEILSPLLTSLPIYTLNANHEMMHNGVPFFEFLQFKHGLGASQPQESTYFCLSNDFYQVIAIDTDYHENGRYRDAALVEWLDTRLQEGRAKRKINILLSQHEPYNPRGVEALLHEDLKPLVLDEQLVDLWFWGDEHYAALHRTGSGAPFIGACIGHGGYPYRRQTGPLVAPPAEVARLEWAETAPRFPLHLAAARHNVGNNGFCWLELTPDAVLLKFIDWRRQLRYHTQLEVRNGWLFMPERPIYQGHPDGECGQPA